MGYELIWEPRGVLKRFYGQVTDRDIADSVARIHGDRRFDTLRYVINDLLDGTGHDVPLHAVEEIAAIDDAAAISNPHIRVALVAAIPDFIELANQYAGSTLKIYPTRVFRLWTRPGSGSTPGCRPPSRLAPSRPGRRRPA